MHGYFKYNDRSRLDICLLKNWVEWELTMVVGKSIPRFDDSVSKEVSPGFIFN